MLNLMSDYFSKIHLKYLNSYSPFKSHNVEGEPKLSRDFALFPSEKWNQTRFKINTLLPSHHPLFPSNQTL